MNTIVICTPNDKIRQDNVTKQFENQSFKYIEHELFKMPALMYTHAPSTGIMRSFKQAIRYAKVSGWKEVLCLEDDFNCLSPDALERMFSIWEYMGQKEGILLGGIYEGELVKVEQEFSWVKGKFSGLHATIIPELLYNKILDEAIEPLNLDHWISTKSNILTYVCDPMLIMQQDGIFSYNARQITNYTKDLHLKYNLINKQKDDKPKTD